MKNEKVYKANFIEFSKWKKILTNTSFNAQITFKNADFGTGTYEGLRIKSVDPGYNDLDFLVKKQKNFSEFGYFFWLMLPGFMYLGIQSIKTTFNSTHFTLDFNYKFSTFIVFIIGLYFSFAIENSLSLILIILLDLISYSLFMVILDCKGLFSLTMIKTLKKNSLWVLISILVSAFLLWSIDFFPFIFALPSLMWIVDYKFSADSQMPSSILIIGFIRCFFILSDFYLPCTITNMENSYLVEFAVPVIYIYIGFCLIFIPITLICISEKKVPRDLIKLKEVYYPKVVFLHGKEGKNDPRCLLEGMKDKIGEVEFSLFGLEDISDNGRHIRIFSPLQLIGHYTTKSADINFQANPNDKEYLDFYRYRKSGFKSKPDIRFRLATKEYSKNLKFGITLNNVLTPLSANKNKMISLNLGTKGK